jgi:AcrR family transcriptional regulator
MSDPAAEQPASLRAEQVAQTRGALVAAGRRLFGGNGFRATSVEDLAREARVTTGALYHHFPTKTALFEAFLDGVLQPDMQRILIVDGPAVLGLARYTELDEQYAHAVIVHALTAAAQAGTITVEDPETATRLLLGALTRGAMLIANSPDPVETRHAVAKSMRALLSSFTP